MADFGGQSFKQHGFTGVSWMKQNRKYQGCTILTEEEASDLPDSLRTGAKQKQELTVGLCRAIQVDLDGFRRSERSDCAMPLLTLLPPHPTATRTGCCTSCAARRPTAS
jgi:hypothetical protein